MIRLAASLAALLMPLLVSAGQAPRWEAGVGVGSLDFPLWRGSADRKTFTAPLPYFVWRGEHVRADRDGARGLLWSTRMLELDISVGATVPVDSEDDTARAGMADLDPLLELGPSLRWYLYQDGSGALSLRMPLRAAWSVGADGVRHQGWTLNPALVYRTRYRDTGWQGGVSVGPRFASRDYHGFFYDVGVADATAVRPAYQARAGYSGTSLSLSASRKFHHVWLGAFARYDNLDGARFTDSPLVETKDAWMLGLGISVVLGRSREMVNVRP